MAPIQFAIATLIDADSWRVMRRAEELGFTRVWWIRCAFA
jgi:hypothetical protein